MLVLNAVRDKLIRWDYTVVERGEDYDKFYAFLLRRLKKSL
ncbi:hypothetical protein [Spirosoma luteum]|nr:hypothetical protein [Spirosoma luteum]